MFKIFKIPKISDKYLSDRCKKIPKMVFFFVMTLIITSHTILDSNTISATDITTVYSIKQEVLSKAELVQSKAKENTLPPTEYSSSSKKKALKINLISFFFASALSPGITLLKVAYLANENGTNLEQWLGIFWLIAIIDFFGDKIPGFAVLYQNIQYPMLVASGLLFVTSSGSSSIITYVLAPLVSILIQPVRQFSTLFLDGITAGFATIPRSIIEDVLAIIILFNL